MSVYFDNKDNYPKEELSYEWTIGEDTIENYNTFYESIDLEFGSTITLSKN